MGRVMRALGYLRYFPKTFQLLWRVSPLGVGSWFTLLLLQGLLPVAGVMLTQEVVDNVVAAVANENADPATFYRVIWPAGLFCSVLLLTELLGGIAAWIREHNASLMQDVISGMIHEKSAGLDMAFFESSAYYDHLHRARTESSYRPTQLIENTGTLFQSGVTLISMSAVLLPFGLWIPAILLVSTLPAFCVVLHNAVRHHRWRQQNTAEERRSWYYDHVLTERETAAEQRLFHLTYYFIDRYRRLRERLRKERLGLVRDQNLGRLGAAIFALAALAGCVAWMGWRAVQGAVTLGELALFYAAFSKGQQMLKGLLSGMGEIYGNLLFLGDLFAFLDLKSEVEELSPVDDSSSLIPIRMGIAFECVAFAYPGNCPLVFENLDLEIPAGKTIAVVGQNGSGKSTLIRLLCRFYDPARGRILIDGKDLRSFPQHLLRRSISVLFQEPVTYHATAHDNVAFGDLRRADDRAAVAQAIADAGAESIVKALPEGANTQLGKWLDDGVELSVGEWQRLALARAFLRQASLILLDEPTSAMDSWSEAEWMGRLKALVKGRTTLIITHRFTTAMRADHILVMDKGRIVESGSHEELLAQNGRYADSWRYQMAR